VSYCESLTEFSHLVLWKRQRIAVNPARDRFVESRSIEERPWITFLFCLNTNRDELDCISLVARTGAT
jgi:hypothetical protein